MPENPRVTITDLTATPSADLPQGKIPSMGNAKLDAQLGELLGRLRDASTKILLLVGLSKLLRWSDQTKVLETSSLFV